MDKRLFSRLCAAGCLVAFSATVAQAATYYWDSNNGTAGFGSAAGTWAVPTNGTATLGWSTNAAGTTVVNGNSVTTTTSDDLNFGSALGLGYSGTITVSGTVDAGNLTTYSTRAINGANHITLSGGTAINLAGTSIINTVADDVIFTISTALTGAGTSLTKTGVGTLALSGANTFAGQLTVAQGVLSINAINNNSTNGTLGNSANAVILGSTGNNGVLRYTGGNAASDKAFTLATGGTGAFDVTTGNTLTLNGAIGGGGRLYKTGVGTVLTTVGNGYSGGTLVGGGTLSVGSSSSLGTNVNTNNITIQNSGRLLLAAATNIGGNQSITLSSSSNNGAPVSSTNGGANAGGALAVLGLGYNGLPANISQANTNGGVIAINGVTGYNTDLSSVLASKNLFLGAIGTSTFTGGAGTVVAGNGSLYRLGGGGGQITFNTTNLFTSGNGLQVGSTSVNGGGTVVVQAAQDYTGVTTVSQGALTLSGANGTATGSSGFTLNGGRLFLDSSGTNNADRIGTVAVNLSNGGEIHLSGNAAGTTETIGNLNLGAGYSTVTAQATTVSSTLAADAFNRTNNGTALFRGTALGQNAAVQGQVTLSDTSGLSFVGTTTLNNAANGDTNKDVKIIPYLVGATAFNGTGDSFVTYDDTTGFRVLNTTNQFTVNTFTTGHNTRLTSAQTGITSATINSLVLSNSGISTIADGATLTVTSGAILVTGGNSNLNQAGTTGILDFGANTGYLTTISSSAIGARITGSGGLVKSGSGELSLTNVNNSFTGDIIINSGSLRTGANGTLGDAANNIVVNGNVQYLLPTGTLTRGITINNGALLTLNQNGTTTFSRDITGTGGMIFGGGFSNGMVFNGTSNSFEGPIILLGTGNGNYETRVSLASLADSTTANGRIVFSVNNASRADGSQFAYTGTTDLLLANRQIELASALVSPTFGHQIRSAGTGTLSISTDLIVSTPIHQTLHLNGTNTGANTFSGKIIDGDGKVALTKSQAGRWILSGANTFTGDTTNSGGTLELGNSLALQNSALDATNSITGTASAGLRTTVTTLTIGGLNGTKNLSDLFTTTSGGYSGVTSLTLNPGAGVTTSYSGVIADGAAGMSLIKTGAGTQILTGANTYTGATMINGGTLALGSAGSIDNTGGVVLGSGTFDVSATGGYSIANLSGSGSVAGALTVTNSLAIGSSPGTVNFEDLTLADTATFTYEVTGGGLTADLGNVSGALDITDSTLSMVQLGTYTLGDKFTLFGYTTGNLTGTFLGLPNGSTVTDNLGGAWEINYADVSAGLNGGTGDLFVTVMAVPEPGALLILGAGAALLGLRFARRRA